MASVRTMEREPVFIDGLLCLRLGDALLRADGHQRRASSRPWGLCVVVNIGSNVGMGTHNEGLLIVALTRG